MNATLVNHHAKRMPQYRIGMIMNTNAKTEIMVIACTAAPSLLSAGNVGRKQQFLTLPPKNLAERSSSRCVRVALSDSAKACEGRCACFKA